MASLERLRARGWKSFLDIELELHPLNVLIGANGVGKSNFISLFRFLRAIAREELQLFVEKEGGAQALLHLGSPSAEEIGIELFARGNRLEMVFESTRDNRLVFARDVVYWSGYMGETDMWTRNPTSGHKESRLPQDVARFGGAGEHLLDTLRNLQVYHFHDTSTSARIRHAGPVDDNRFLHSDGRNLAAYLYYLQERHPTSFRQVVQTVRLVAPYFKDFQLAPRRLDPGKIVLEWNQHGTSEYFNASQLSDGTLRFIALATMLLQPDLPRTILVDEPELGLHPFAVTLLGSMMRTASKRAQLIVSTQSSLLVDQMKPEDIVVVDHRQGSSRLHRLDPAELDTWLEKYSLGELWLKNRLGGRPAR